MVSALIFDKIKVLKTRIYMYDNGYVKKIKYKLGKLT